MKALTTKVSKISPDPLCVQQQRDKVNYAVSEKKNGVKVRQYNQGDGLQWAVLACSGVFWTELGSTGLYRAVLGCNGL